VVDRAGGSHLASSPDRHVERFEDELDGLVGADRPAEAEAAVGVGDNRDVAGALPSRELREVGDPQAVGPADGEVATDEVGRERMLLRPRRRAFTLLGVDRAQAGLAHQPGDALLPDLEAAAQLQFLEHAREP
jgi:hypothetical protein